MVKAIFVLLVLAAVGAMAAGASATTCVEPRARFAGGYYNATEVSAADAPSLPVSEPATFEDYDAEEVCDVTYVSAQVRSLAGVSPSVAFVAPDGLVWVTGGRCDTPALLRCLRTPLRFRGRSYHPVRQHQTDAARQLGPGGIGRRRVEVRAIANNDPNTSVQVGGWQFVAEDVCRMASHPPGFAACLRDPRVVAFGPLPESGRGWWPFALAASLGAAFLAGGALAVRRRW